MSPLTPVYTYINPAGDKVIRYNLTVTCDADRTVEIEQRVYEADIADADDLIVSFDRSRYFDTVSYTHLDVYKRQISPRLPRTVGMTFASHAHRRTVSGAISEPP